MLIKIIALLLVSTSSFCLGYFVKDIKDEIYEIDVAPWIPLVIIIIALSIVLLRFYGVK